ncbi:hypothetical protein [Frigoribacterium sp. RIT-PI-h]|uniref:DUF6993 domain-containing protein n=1 Tax=Frigoribacterium sp. RIT-PI-h TaxID=1690245 RepID=UPI0006B8E535|nr:hypothetical protein [Frigoribacterium sp. RIT-PI-h]KPG87494.1 hypothetical protein AEQ27_02255 [Frigoribacterium sp. RIT-PI-h]
MTGSRPPRGLALAAILLAVVVPLAGCTSSPEPAPTTPPTATSTGAPAFSSESTAAEALAHFDEVNAATVAANARPGGRAVVDALVAAGFDKSTMQVTADTTSIGRDADSVQFSVLWGQDCLIGQVSGAGYSSQTAPVLGTGACLVGSTRAIDW